MSAEKLVSKYISSAEQVFGKILAIKAPFNMNVEKVTQVLDLAKAYLEDAKYYREKKKFEVSLTSVAYCEGLLDALRLLGTVNFEWPRKVKETKRAK